MMSYKMMQLYNEFTKAFLPDFQENHEDINRLMKNQSDYFEDICEKFIPTFTFNLENGSFENINAEGLKFLQSTRIEIKSSKISDITLP